MDETPGATVTLAKEEKEHFIKPEEVVSSGWQRFRNTKSQQSFPLDSPTLVEFQKQVNRSLGKAGPPDNLDNLQCSPQTLPTPPTPPQGYPLLDISRASFRATVCEGKKAATTTNSVGQNTRIM